MRLTRISAQVARLAALFVVLRADAQSSPLTPGVIRGTVVDSASQAPLASALITIRSTSDSSLITRAQVNVAGDFVVRGLRTGQYSVRISAIGRRPSVKSVSLTERSPLVDVGKVSLGTFAVALQGVQVQGEADAVVVEPDRTSYRAKDVAPGAGNASEVLEQTPAVAVDQDGKVSLRGNESVVVQVNGRPTPMTGVQLGAYLKTLPASVIDRVEVIPNPSAKYDPDGTAGIINVVLKPNVDLGLSGGALFNVLDDSRYTFAGNLGYQRGALTSAMSLSSTEDVRNTPGSNYLTLFDPQGAMLGSTGQSVEERKGGGGQTFSSTVDYKLNKRDVLSNALTLGRRTGVDDVNTAYSVLGGSGASGARYDRRLRSAAFAYVFDEDIAFKRTFDPRKHELSMEVRFTGSRESDTTGMWREEQGNRLDREINDLTIISKQAIAQVDYVRTPRARTKIETGAKSNIRWLDRDFAVQQDSLGVGVWSPSIKSNALEFREAVHAAYGVVSQGVGRVELQAGLRVEVADRDFSLAASSQAFPFRYSSLFPSAVARFTANDRLDLKVSYSRRVRRPTSDELNPFPTYYDIQNIFLGSPQLRPEYTDAFELGVVRSTSFATLQATPFFRRTSNLIRTVIQTGQQIDGRDVTTFRYANIATSRAWGADLNLSLPAGRRITGFTSLNLSKTEVDGVQQASLSPTGYTWTGRVNTTWQMTPALLTNFAYVYRAAIPVPNGRFYRARNATITVRKKVNDRSTVGFSLVDPLAMNDFHIEVAGPAIAQRTQRTLGLRGVFVRYQYSFGRTPRVREVQSTAEPPSGPP